MEVGLLFTFRNPPPWERPVDELYSDTLDEIALADELGFDAIWLAEHHFTDDGWSPSPLTLAAAVATRTKQAKIGTFVLLLPQHDPVRIAEAATAVDILSGGRLVLGLGMGYRRSEYEAVGRSMQSRGDVMDEALEILIRCFEEDRFSFHGRYFDITDVAMTPQPVQRPRPPILLAGTGDRALQRAVRFGCEGLAVYPPRDVHHRYTELLEAAGKDPDRVRYYAIVLGFVAPTDDEAWETARDHADWERDHYREWLADAGLPDAFPRGTREDFVIGSPQRWTDAFAELLDANPGVPCHHAVIELVSAGMSHDAKMAAIELTASRVLPTLREL